jgi:segregation and condensation protein B
MEMKPLFLQLSRDDQKAALEALIFASEEPLSQKNLLNIIFIGAPNIPVKKLDVMMDESAHTDQINEEVNELADNWNITPEYIEELISEVNHELTISNRPFQIIKVAGGYQYCTRREFGELIHHLDKTKSKRRFSQAAMECLAIIAYRQPITKPEIDQIRGVNSNEVVNSLIEKGIVQPMGQKETIGKPWLFGTTEEFLKIFGINSTEELPKLKELEDIAAMLEAEKPDMEIVFDMSEETSMSEQSEIPDPDTITDNLSDESEVNADADLENQDEQLTD